ncbi:hypothetical protein JQ615_24390 [Bradyrhizobium jicamae]|uniref:Transposase n=1 Tax=Bradyrhizobium jicamae TaxID=280332 RepID=A0ABS5FNZ9_9BRAD|nr:hypothetical protein [Bradyrhizobium jicamae]MBR0798532.1 hypothetical protein [Bradyrhizobium jicamae]
MQAWRKMLRVDRSDHAIRPALSEKQMKISAVTLWWHDHAAQIDSGTGKLSQAVPWHCNACSLPRASA